jgi:hypothetical protein
LLHFIYFSLFTFVCFLFACVRCYDFSNFLRSNFAFQFSQLCLERGGFKCHPDELKQKKCKEMAVIGPAFHEFDRAQCGERKPSLLVETAGDPELDRRRDHQEVKNL